MTIARAWVVEIPGHVARVNELMYAHWRTRCRLRKRDDRMVGLACRLARVTPAAGRRRVQVHVVLGPRQRVGDSDDPFAKSLLDALVHAGALVDDSPKWCELEDTTYSRGARAGMAVTLTEAT